MNLFIYTDKQVESKTVRETSRRNVLDMRKMYLLPVPVALLVEMIATGVFTMYRLIYEADMSM